MTITLRAIGALILLAPFFGAAARTPEVVRAPCEDNPELSCATGVRNVEWIGARFDVDFVLGNYDSQFQGLTFPYFLGDRQAGRRLIELIEEALNAEGDVAGAVGAGLVRSYVRVPVLATDDDFSAQSSRTVSGSGNWNPVEVTASKDARDARPEFYYTMARFTALEGLPLQMLMSGINGLSVRCENLSDPQQVVITLPTPPGEDERFDCERAGLQTTSGDRLRLTVQAATYGAGTNNRSTGWLRGLASGAR